MAGTPCFTLVCLRQLEEEIALEDGIEALSLSHDRRLLSLRDRRSRCFCYSCDNTRPCFLLPRPVAQNVQFNLWLHLPAEKSVLLDRNLLSEYPGIPCLIALERENAALTFCRFFRIEGLSVNIVDLGMQEVQSPVGGQPIIQWGVQEIAEALPPNTVWRSSVPLASLIGLFPDCRYLLNPGGEDSAAGEEAANQSVSCKHLLVRLCGARPDSVVMFINDTVALFLSLTWQGVSVSNCFFLQQPTAGLSSENPMTFCDITACQDWVFAITPPPNVYLLIWYIRGVAFHAIPLCDCLPTDVHFVSIEVALDLLGVALCDNHHNIWIVSLDRYFDGAPKGLDWELLKERQRCAAGVGVLDQTNKDYQELSVFPEAFGLQVSDEPCSGSATRRMSSKTSLMDCLVEGVPTYGIPIPGGAFGSGDQFLEFERAENTGVDKVTTDADGGPRSDSNVMRCVPYAWHERIHQTQEWLDLDRRWTVHRKVDGMPQSIQVSPDTTGIGIPGGRASTGRRFGSLEAANMLNGFSVPAQHRLGDDDFHYSLYAALQRHAQREFKSRLPPWLTKVTIPRQAQKFNPPMIDVLSESGKESGSESGSELANEEVDDDGSRPSMSPETSRVCIDGSMDGHFRHEVQGGYEESGNLQGLPDANAADGHVTCQRHRKVAIGRISLAITVSHVFCEIWESLPEGEVSESPWGLCVIPRPTFAERKGMQPQTQIDHLTGGLLEMLDESGQPLAKQTATTFRSQTRWRSLFTQNHIWYMLSDGRNLHTLLLNQSPVRVISNLLVFENRLKASRLCALNGWNAKQLPVLTLFLGLRFRELDEIRQSLGLLRPDQEMEACQMVMGFIHSGYSCASLELPFSPSPPAVRKRSVDSSIDSNDGGKISAESSVSQLPADRSFVSRLLEIAMQFLTKLIQTRVMQIQECEGACRALTYLQPKHAASEEPQYASMVNELSQLTVHMQSLRTLQQQLIASFGDEKAYDSGITIQCPPQLELQDQVKVHTNGPVLPDSSVALAQKLTGGSIHVGSMRSIENTEAIVRAALISGKVSSALNIFHELALEEGDGTSAGSRVFEEFRVVAGRLAYQLACNQQIDFLFMAMHMLRNVGENVNKFFKAVAFHTSKRVVRRRLLRHLSHMQRLTKDDQDLICLVNLLENLYTNPCYTTEFNRMTTGLVTGQYPQRAHNTSMPPFYTWPAGGHAMLLVGLSCDGAVEGHINVDVSTTEHGFEQQTSLRELPVFQRMPLEMHDIWAGYQTPVMAAMLEMPADARRAWNNLPCGDIEDLDAQPVLGLMNFHKSSNLEHEQDTATVADLREEFTGGEGDPETSSSQAAAKRCRQCRLDGLKDELAAENLMVGNGADPFTDALGLGEASPKCHTMGYLHLTLSWMRRWSWDTRARILMEKAHYQPRLVESLPWLQPPPEVEEPEKAWRLVWLDFLVAHQDWRGLASWVRSTSLRRSDRADDHGRHSVDLRHLEERGLPYCTSYAKEILLQELGKRGIFCVGDVSSFQALLRRLAQCGRLFDEGYTSTFDDDSSSVDGLVPAECPLPLDRLLPRRSVCPFHQFFIHFCIDLDLPSVMLLYMQTYDLATTMGDLRALQLKHAKKPWASLLLVGRLGNAHLFAASLQHAAILFSDKGYGEKHTELSGTGGWASGASQKNGSDAKDMRCDVDSVPFMPLNVLAERSPLSFLATLMFAPVASALDAAKAPQDSPWFVDIALFRKAVEEYPTLCAAFFPAGLEQPAGGPEKPVREPSSQLKVSLLESVAEANRNRWLQQETLHLDGETLSSDQALACITQQSVAQSSDLLPVAGSAKETATQRTLDDMMSFKEDVSLSELLSDVAAFDVKNALKPLPIFGKDLVGSLGIQDDLDHVSSEAGENLGLLLAAKEKFHDKLEEGYFLAQGRPMMAFHVLMTRCAQRMQQQGEFRLPLVMPAEDSKQLHRVAKDVALHNLLNEGVVSSTVCLLELCSLETEMLRVDVQAATRIYEHQVRQARESSTEDTDRPRAAAASVIELFMSFPDTEIMKSRDEMPNRAAETAINSQHLLTALRLLEESTWALDPHPSAPTVSSMQSLAMDSPWHLVALFCRVHCLPRSLTLLHELARNGDWVMFLHESDLQQCPAETVLDVVDGYFTDVPLQSHLKILAYSIAAQERCDSREVYLKTKGLGDGAQENSMEQPEVQQSKKEEAAALAAQVPQGKLKPEPESRHVVDAIDFLDQCRMRPGRVPSHSTGSGLLRHALVNRTARLAVVASAFSDVSLLQCMAVWLSVNTDVSQGPSSADGVDSAAPDYSPAEVASQIASLCRKSCAFSLVLRALKIFDPTNPLVDFVKFHRAFMQCRFQSCQEHLKRFVERRESESQPELRTEKYCLEMVPYVISFSEDMVHYLLNAFPRGHLQLLTALDQANFSPHYSQLYRSFRLVQKCELDVDFRVPPSDLLQLLISRKMFSEAREWAKSSGIVGDTIVFEEVTGMIFEFRQGVWWNVLDERLQLWHKCYDAFLLRNYPAVGAANVFLDITSKLEPDLFAREQLMLLCIAFELLNSSKDEQKRQKELQDSSGKQLQVPSKEQLNRIKLSMLLILTGTNKDMAAELDFSPLDLSYSTLRTLVHRIPESVSALPLYHSELGGSSSVSWGSTPAGGTPSVPALLPEQRGLRSELLPYLDTAISSLINCDEILWARELAMGFTFESADLKLAEAMEMVASGHHEEALRGLAANGSRFDGLEAHDGGIEHVLQSLRTQCSQRIALFCRRCMVFYSVSTKIGMDYRQVSQVEASQLLDRLLSPQPYEADIGLCKSLLPCYVKAQNKASLAGIIANRFIQSMRSFGALEWPKNKLDEFVSIIGSSQDMIGDEALRHVHQHELPVECEVEVLIMVYHAYVQACSEKSIGDLLRFICKRVEVYVENRRFALLMRLLVAIPEYHAMEYMFGHLVRHGQLELLLEKGRFQDAAQKPALAVALIRYLQTHFPRNFELLVKVHLCFGLEAQLAELLEHRAILLTQSLGRNWVEICSEEGEEQLLMCLSLFLQCSRFYLRGQRYQKHLMANERAALICLQLKAVQIHLATSLQEQQSAQRAIEQQELANSAEDPLMALGLGIGVNVGGSSGPIGESPEAEPGIQDGLNPVGLAPTEVQQADSDEPAVTAEEVKNPVEELRDDQPLAQIGAPSPEESEGPQPPDEGTASENAAATGTASEGAPAHPSSVAVTPAAPTSPVEDPTPPPTSAMPALGPAGDPFVVINLMAEEVEVFAEYHHDFVMCFQVLCVYRHTYGEELFKVWPRALYRQVVLLGNFAYLHHFVRHVPLEKEYLEGVVQLYLHEPCPEQFPLRAYRMKQLLLDGVPNLEIRYQLARQLAAEFADISIETASLMYMA